MIDLNYLLNEIWETLSILCFLYAVPYLIRKGWGDAENRTKKVCDMCFRDIKKMNEHMKEEGL